MVCSTVCGIRLTLKTQAAVLSATRLTADLIGREDAGEQACRVEAGEVEDRSDGGRRLRPGRGRRFEPLDGQRILDLVDAGVVGNASDVARPAP